ncbi:MAG: hypothetical protein R6W75_05930 [Smithellaceae bacterium]
MKPIRLFCAALIMATVCAGQALAHTPLCACVDNGDGTITCEGGFSDGSSAAGVSLKVKDSRGKTLIKGRMDRLSTFEFERPEGMFTVVFDAGPGHVVEIPSRVITQ